LQRLIVQSPQWANDPARIPLASTQQCAAARNSPPDKFVDLTGALLYFWKADRLKKTDRKNLNA
jgi:hypothetical protein